MLFTAKNALMGLSLLQAANAHMGMTNFYVNGADQGDGICVRMNPNWDEWSFPIRDLDSSDMACGNYVQTYLAKNHD